MNAFILCTLATQPFFHSLKQKQKMRKHSILNVNHKNAGKMKRNFIRLGKTQKQMLSGKQPQTYKLCQCELGLI